MRRWAAACAILLCTGRPSVAHRLDEYLQATMLSIEEDRIEAQVRLAPGVAVVPAVLSLIDTDSDGIVSGAEENAYAKKVLGDLSVTVDGDPLRLTLVSARFPAWDAMREGFGEILLEFRADLPRGGPNRRLLFENHHRSALAAYLVNTLVPSNVNIRLAAQKRNQDQSVYQLDFVQTGIPSGPWSLAWWSGGPMWIAGGALVLLARLAWQRGLRARTHSLPEEGFGL